MSKKFLSILLGLAFIIASAFVPLTAFAIGDDVDVEMDDDFEDETPQSLTSGWQIKGQGSKNYNAEADTVSFSGVMYQSLYITVNDLEVNTDYILSLDHTVASAAYNFGNPTYVVPGGAVEWSTANGTYAPANSDAVQLGWDAGLTGTGVSVSFTTDSENTSYTFIFVLHGVDENGDGTIGDVSIKNTTITKLEETEKLLKGWQIKGQGTKKINDANGTITFDNVMYQTIYTTLTNLEPNTEYVFSFTHDILVQPQLFGNPTYIVPGDSVEWDGTRPNNSDTIMLQHYTTFDGKGAKVSFKTDSEHTAYTLIYILHNVDGNGDGTIGDVTLGNMKLEKADNDNIISGKELLESNKVLTQSVVDLADDSLALNFTGSGLEFTLNCEGDVKINLISDNYNCMRLNCFVDGVKQNQIVLPIFGNREITLAGGLEKGEHTFKIERITENVIGNLWLTSLEFNGELVKKEEYRKLSIDFFGDSITAGWGAAAEPTDDDCSYCYMDGTATYAARTAYALNANYNAFAFSGIGVNVDASSNGSGTGTMIKYFPDFKKNSSADYVVINLGTNDFTKYQNAGLTEQQVKDGFATFARMVRAYYKDSTIIFAGGMITDGTDSFVESAVNALKADGDEKVYSVKLSKGTSGNAGHPNNAEHLIAANELTAFISELEKLPKHTAGDINNDNNVNLKDLITLAQYVADWGNINYNRYALDTNGDDMVTLDDVNNLARYLAGWEDVTIY